MASIKELQDKIDLHDLAGRIGLKREKPGKGNYRSPHHADANPSISIFTKNGKQAWNDFSNDERGAGGDCVSLVMYVVPGMNSVPEAMRYLHELYAIPFDRQEKPEQRRERTKIEFIADQVTKNPQAAVPYLVGRGILEETVQRAIKRGSVGYNDWTSPTVAAGEVGHGGPAVAFVCRDAQTTMVRAVDVRYIDPDLNGGRKTSSQGDKDGVPWFIDRAHLAGARTVYVVESAINALCIESCNLPFTAALAIRGTGTWQGFDWRQLAGKQVVLALDADPPKKDGIRPGAHAAWGIYDALAAVNVAALMVDQGKWYAGGFNDVADIAKNAGIDTLRDMLRELEPWCIPGLPGKDTPPGRSRVFLPAHDFGIYWRYRVKPDFTSYVAKVEKNDEGEDGETFKFEDVTGFRVAAVSRVTIQSATATMSGEADAQPTTVFAVSVQMPRHGANLVRRVFTDERLHNIEHWKKFGPVFSQTRFLRLINILERSAECGARDALNFVGLAWRNGRAVVNEGPDCYFTEPEKQCPYHNLTFPAGPVADARRVVEAYQATFGGNAAAILLVWALGGHLKAFTGFWPHMIVQARKGSGKSTLIKRLERTIGMTMFGGQSLQTEFRLLTSVSHTSHPVGWEEISARRQDVINVAVAMLQESYQHTVTRRGSDLTEFLISAPVLLAGEDVPVKSLTGKVVRCELDRKGDLIAESLPRFPVRAWLQFLAGLDRERVANLLNAAERAAWQRARAAPAPEANVNAPIGSADLAAGAEREPDPGAARMVRNYAAMAAAWTLLCEFAGMAVEQGGFLRDLRATMNSHIADTSGDREPWVWILERVFSEIESHQFTFPYVFDIVDGEQCLLITPSHVMDHMSGTSRLRDEFNALPVKSTRVFKRQLGDAGVVVKDNVDRRINSHRHAHLCALGLNRLAEYGLHLSVPEDDQGMPSFMKAANE